jgi:hypothetical protein
LAYLKLKITTFLRSITISINQILIENCAFILEIRFRFLSTFQVRKFNLVTISLITLQRYGFS